ncbi:MAG: hypothetical protein ACTHMI_22860 [Mucilaginibacter sp.]
MNAQKRIPENENTAALRAVIGGDEPLVRANRKGHKKVADLLEERGAHE